MSKVTVSRLWKMKERGEKITMITAYDYPTALQAEKAGIDMVLVGALKLSCFVWYYKVRVTYI